MTIGLNNLLNNWFNSKTVDTNSDGKISKDELSIFANKVAQKPQNERSSEDLLADTLLNSSKSGQSFFDLASAFDGQSGLSKQDLTTFASPAGKKDEITYNDFIAVGQTQTIDQKAETKETPKEPQTTNYEIKKGDTLWAISKKLKQENANYANKSIPEIIQSLQEANDIQDANKIYAGETLKVLADPKTTAAQATDSAKTTNAQNITAAAPKELQNKMNQITVKSPNGGLEANTVNANTQQDKPVSNPITQSGTTITETSIKMSPDGATGTTTVNGETKELSSDEASAKGKNLMDIIRQARENKARQYAAQLAKQNSNTNQEETNTFTPFKIQNQQSVFNPSMTQDEAVNNVINSTATVTGNSKQVFNYIMSQPDKPVKKKSRNTNTAVNTDNQNNNSGSAVSSRQVGISPSGLADFVRSKRIEFGQ